MSELLRPEVWRDHVFFVMRTFYAIERRRYDYSITAIKLSKLFDALSESVQKVSVALVDLDRSSIFLEHSQDHTLVSISRVMVSDHSWKSTAQEGAVQLCIGGKFWEAGSDTIRNYFSVYDIEFDPARPATERFRVRSFPEPQRHPDEEPNYLIAFASAAPSFTHCKRGILMHSVCQSRLRLQFHLSVIGQDAKGELRFAKVDKALHNYLEKTWNKLRVPIEEYSGALVFMSVDCRTVDIWYPI